VRKRLIASVGLATALLSMTACRSSPEVAAYVGNTAITEQRVNEVQNATAVAVDDKGTLSKKVDRQAVVQTLVLLQACEDFRATHPFESREVTQQQVVEDLATQVAPTEPQQQEKWATQIAETEYVSLRQKAVSCVSGLPATPAAPTDEEIREIYDNAIAAGAVDPNIPLEQIAPQIANDQQIIERLAVKRKLDEVIAASNVALNPRYGELPIALLAFQNGPAVSVSVGEPNEVVQER
jgi:hypothetical protein